MTNKGDLISRETLKKDFKDRLEKAKNWKENALNRGDDEIAIRADATLTFICEVIMTIDNAPTIKTFTLEDIEEQYRKGLEKGLSEWETERPQGEWIEIPVKRDLLYNTGIKYTCSICGYGNCYGKPPFCMYCGADMRGES